MRTLTQVWVFFVSLTFLFLLLGFQIAGRTGLFVAFLISLFFIYATLHRSLRLFRRRLKTRDYSGNDPTGFLKEINAHKLRFGFREIRVYLSDSPTPPLIWKNRAGTGHLVLNSGLLENLSPSEIRLLALLLLSHLENRSFILTPLLSVFHQSFLGLDFIAAPFSWFLTSLFRIPRHIYRADRKFRQAAEVSAFEAGYFTKRLHGFSFHRTSKSSGTEYFSVLSLRKMTLNRYGIPGLDDRLRQMMGFSLNEI